MFLRPDRRYLFKKLTVLTVAHGTSRALFKNWRYQTSGFDGFGGFHGFDDTGKNCIFFEHIQPKRKLTVLMVLAVPPMYT